MAKQRSDLRDYYPGVTVEVDGTPTGGLVPLQPTAQVSGSRRMPINGRGNYYDARVQSKSVPLYQVDPSELLGIMNAYRAILSCFRHNFFGAVGCTIAAGYFLLFSGSALLNLIRTSPVAIECNFLACLSPVTFGANIVAFARPIAGDAADKMHDSVLKSSSLQGRNPAKPSKATVRPE